MYEVALFKETRPDVLYGLIAQYPLAAVAYQRAGIEVEHVPLQLCDAPEQDASGTVVLEGHVSRMNPIWTERKTEAEFQDVVAVFQGPQGYVSPGWYETKKEHGRVVPTWNYAVVHAHGRLRLIDDVSWLRAQVNRLTDRHETGREDAWSVSDAPPRFTDGQLRGIIGLTIEITRLEGKWKMSQNRSEGDQTGVVLGLLKDEKEHLADSVVETIRNRPE